MRSESPEMYTRCDPDDAGTVQCTYTHEKSAGIVEPGWYCMRVAHPT